MSRYWIADLHLGHTKVAELRGFWGFGFDDSEHDEAILGQLDVLSPDDDVWILGDISSGRPEDEGVALERLALVPPRLHLIAGNHDSVSSTHRKGYTRQRRFLEVFESVQQFGRVRIHGQDVLMSHYPYARSGDGPDRGEARYLEYRLPDEGLPLIHGHTHQGAPFGGVWEPYRRDETGRILLGWKPDLSQFCVSWDAHRRLVTEHDLNQWLNERQ